jgi:hypothetical protein
LGIGLAIADSIGNCRLASGLLIGESKSSIQNRQSINNPQSSIKSPIGNPNQQSPIVIPPIGNRQSAPGNQ